MMGRGGQDKEGKTLSQAKVRRSLNEINKMSLCQFFFNNARKRQRSVNNIFPRFHQSKIRNGLGSG